MFTNEGVYWIRNKSLSSRLIDVRNNPYVHVSERTSNPIGLLSPGLAHTQLWLVEEVQDAHGEFYVIRNYATGSVLDIKDESSTEGSAIVVQPYKSTGEVASTQHWRVESVDDDDDNSSYYRIINQKTGTVLDQTRKSRDAEEYSIESWNCNNGEHQLWSFEPATLPTMYWILNISSNRGLAYKPSSTNLVTLETKSRVPSRSQLWYLESLLDDDDYWRIRHVGHEDKVLDLSGDDNKSTLAWAENGGDNQRWMINNSDTNEDKAMNIICGRNNAVLYGEGDQDGEFHVRGSGDSQSFEGRSSWLVVPYPVPSLFWNTIESSSSGELMAESDGNVTSTAPQGEAGHNAQWRFVHQGREPYFAIVNRQTGNNLRDSSGNLAATDNNATSDEYYWTLDLDRNAAGHRITNVETSNVISCVDNGTVALANIGEMGDQEWVINEVNQVFPSVSFAASYAPIVPGKVTLTKNPELTVAPDFIKEVFDHLIGQMDFPSFPAKAKARQLAGTERKEVENEWGLKIPKGLQQGSEKPGWCRIDLQGKGTKQDAGRANIQGQWNKKSVFHLLVDHDTNFGSQAICDVMRESVNKTMTARLVKT